jgi:hypothetical protein
MDLQNLIFELHTSASTTNMSSSYIYFSNPTPIETKGELNKLQNEARKWINRAEVHRRECDRVVIGERLPLLTPKLSSVPQSSLDGYSLSAPNTQNLADFFPMVML